MNKKELLEIRKQFSPENSTISRICSCYVDGDKKILFQSKEAFLSLPQEDEFKYYDIFKKTLSGSIGKNQLNLEFPLNTEEEDGTQNFLLKLRDSKLEDDTLVDQFFQKIIDSYNYGENYYITLIHGAYDIPGRSSDNIEMFDASDEVYSFILCSICPVKLSKAGLGYNPDVNRICDRTRDWVVDRPAKGFLFPSFNDRSTDIHSTLYFTKNPEELQEEFMENIFGTKIPKTVKGQSETFQQVIEETLGSDCDLEVVKNIHESIQEKIEQTKDEPEPLELDAYSVKNILEESGVPLDKLDAFNQIYENNVGKNETLVATNITDTRKFNIQTPDVIIKVNPARTDLVETKIINGINCLVITISDQVEVNGIPINGILTDEV